MDAMPEGDHTAPLAALNMWEYSLFFQIENYEKELKNIAQILKDYDKEIVEYIAPHGEPSQIVLKNGVDLEEEAKYIEMIPSAIKQLIESMKPAESAKEHKKALEEQLKEATKKQEEGIALQEKLWKEIVKSDDDSDQETKLQLDWLAAENALPVLKARVKRLENQIADIYDGPEHKWGEKDNIVEIGLGRLGKPPGPLKVIFAREHIAVGTFKEKLQNSNNPIAGAPDILGRYSSKTGVLATRDYSGFGPFIINEAVKRPSTMQLLKTMHGHNNGFKYMGDIYKQDNPPFGGADLSEVASLYE